MDKTILQKWLKSGYIDRTVLYPTEAGTPQGAICSPVLANMVLDGLEKKLREKYPKATAKSRKAKVNFVRYCDDFIITGSSQELLVQEVKPIVEQFLAERGLELSPEKTTITHINNGFDFLGQNLRKYKGKLLTKPSPKNVKEFLNKVRTLIKGNAQATAGNLIAQLNPIIRGWANFHGHAASKSTFVKVDHAIFQSLWQWAKRRHPKKPKKWIKDKYFQSIGGRNWVFQGEIILSPGKTQTIKLFSAASVPIVRHTKIRGPANPYDPEWEPYFEKRLDVKMEHHLKGKRTWLQLWQEQNGVCPVCHEKITEQTGWHSHHLVWRTHGGTDGVENLVLLHPDCHRQVHSQGLEVVKPRPVKGV